MTAATKKKIAEAAKDVAIAKECLAAAAENLRSKRTQVAVAAELETTRSRELYQYEQALRRAKAQAWVEDHADKLSIVTTGTDWSALAVLRLGKKHRGYRWGSPGFQWNELGTAVRALLKETKDA